MKILIAYDGSGDARTAVSGLQNAGLPARAEAVIVSVAEQWLPPLSEKSAGEADADTAYYFEKYREQIEGNLIETDRSATEAKEKLERYFPGWKIRTQVVSGSPTRRILSTASEFQPDLIVAGAQGLTRNEKTSLGSVSQIILTAATCPVRIAKAQFDDGPRPVRLAVCFDGSADSIKAIETVAARNWKVKPEIGVFIVADPINPLIPGRAFRTIPGVPEEGLKGERKWIESIGETALQRLRETGLSAALQILSGNPRMVLSDRTKAWDADLIFVGARNRESEFSAIGSVALAVAARAFCTVEVVR